MEQDIDIRISAASKPDLSPAVPDLVAIIANILENSNPPLADALTLYGESTELLKHCSELLEKANQQITVLEKDN